MSPSEVSPKHRIDIVRLRFFGRHEIEDHDFSANVLKAVAANLPEAMPVRFRIGVGGRWTPFSLDGESFSVFQTACTTSRVSWQGNKVGFGGSIASLASAQTRATNPAKFNHVEISIDAASLEITQSQSGLKPLLAAIAQVVGAVYVYGSWERDVAYDRQNELWWDNQTDHSDTTLMKGKEWQGLPWDHVWLEWFGADYVPLIQEPLAGLTEPLAGGLLAEYGWDPHERFRRIPRNLIAETRSGGRAGVVPPGW